MNKSTFLVRKADNLYDLCFSRGHKGIFLHIHEDIFSSLGDGERGLFTVYIDKNDKGYGYFYKCEDPFSRQILNDTLEKFVKDVENQPIT